MPRIPGRVLGPAAAAALLAHALLVRADVCWVLSDDDFGSLGLFLNLLLSLFAISTGRVLLAFLPPGSVGGHGARELPATLATSAALGTLATWRLEGLVASFYPVYALVLLLALVRWMTLPGAMVPRHQPPAEIRGWLERSLWLAAAAWAALLQLTEEGTESLLWLALGVLVFHGLGVARRRRSGRLALLLLAAFLVSPVNGVDGTDYLLPALSLGLGASFLVPWLRRADRRAGLLSAIGFGSSFLWCWDPLAFAGPLVLVGASRPAQRRFALVSVAASAAAGAAVGLAHGSTPARGRLMFADELVARALDLETWGIAWPIVAAAVALGALTFPWRRSPWTPGAIEEPRREALALVALLGLAFAALSLPVSPWFEQQALVIIFPLAALLAGLLLVPAEKPWIRS